VIGSRLSEIERRVKLFSAQTPRFPVRAHPVSASGNQVSSEARCHQTISGTTKGARYCVEEVLEVRQLFVPGAIHVIGLAQRGLWRASSIEKHLEAFRMGIRDHVHWRRPEEPDVVGGIYIPKSRLVALGHYSDASGWPLSKTPGEPDLPGPVSAKATVNITARKRQMSGDPAPLADEQQQGFGRRHHRVQFHILIGGVSVPPARTPQHRRNTELVKDIQVARSFNAHYRWPLLQNLGGAPG